MLVIFCHPLVIYPWSVSEDHEDMTPKIWEICSSLVYDDHAIFISAIHVHLPCMHLNSTFWKRKNRDLASCGFIKADIIDA